jgi:hypothetical protein
MFMVTQKISMRKSYLLTLVLGVVLFSMNSGWARGNSLNEVSQQEPLPEEMPHVFWDCSFCDMGDMNYIKEEVQFIQHVRDRKDADVHVMMTREGTANGGTRYSVFLFGQNGNSNLQDTLRFHMGPDATVRTTREKMVRALRSGLTPYLLKTSLWEKQSIAYLSEGTSAEEPQQDAWRNWVFEISADGFMEVEESQRNYDFGGELKANKITEDVKFELDFDLDYDREAYDINSETVISIHRTYDMDALWVRSLSQHWSAGGFAGFRSSKYDNLAQSYTAAPAIEFSIFPYEEATTSQLTILYRPEYVYHGYMDSTIFNQTEEHLARQMLEMDYEVKRKWGEIDVSMDLSNYFHDFSKNRMSFHSSLNVNVVKGLSVYFNGGVSFIHDQLALRKGNASTEEILTRQQELATNFEYYTRVGVSFTFGSMYNNIVNPRF